MKGVYYSIMTMPMHHTSPENEGGRSLNIVRVASEATMVSGVAMVMIDALAAHNTQDLTSGLGRLSALGAAITAVGAEARALTSHDAEVRRGARIVLAASLFLGGLFGTQQTFEANTEEPESHNSQDGGAGCAPCAFPFVVGVTGSYVALPRSKQGDN